MSSAASQINTKASSNELISGLTFVKNLKSLKASFSKQDNINKYIDLMERIQNKIANTPMYSYIASSLDKNQLNIGVPIYNSDIKFTPQTLVPVQEKSFGWITGSQVCFCAEAFPTVGSKHPDAPKLSVLAAVLRNGYLHSAIREKGGAYGAGAAHDAIAQTFQFYSYRDPKCKETFSEFSNSRLWALDNISENQLEEGILGVISSIDKPMSPAGEAANDFISLIKNKSQEERLEFRTRVKETKVRDLKEMVSKYLSKDSKKAVLAGESFNETLIDQGFEIKII